MISVNEMSQDEAAALWPDIEQYVERALRHDPFVTATAEIVGQQLATGYARLLLAVRDDANILGATVVQLYRAENGRALHVLTTSGVEMETWLDALIEALREMAQANNCIAVCMSGRPGWTRELRKYGFRTHHVQMVMEVESGSSNTIHRPGDRGGERDIGREGIAAAAGDAVLGELRRPESGAVPPEPIRPGAEPSGAAARPDTGAG